MHLYKNPANKFVAGFIGSPSMNFLKGSIQQTGQYYFMDESGNCKICLGSTLSPAVKHIIGGKIQIGIRPEDICLFEDDDDKSKSDCTLTVMAYKDIGNEQLIYMSLGQQLLHASRRIHQI